MTVCKAITPADKPCAARPAAGSEFCFFHDPARKLERRRAQSRGRRHGHQQPSLKMALPSMTTEISLRTPQDIIATLDYTVKLVFRGEIDSKLAYVVAAMANCALKAHGVDIGDQLEQLKILQKADHELPIGSDGYLGLDFEEEEESNSDDEKRGRVA